MDEFGALKKSSAYPGLESPRNPQTISLLCRNHFLVAKRRWKLASHGVAGNAPITSRPERTVEMLCFSDVLSGHDSNTSLPAALWLANILMSLRDANVCGFRRLSSRQNITFAVVTIQKRAIVPRIHYDTPASARFIFHGRAQQVDRPRRVSRPRGPRRRLGRFPNDRVAHRPEGIDQRKQRKSQAGSPHPERSNNGADSKRHHQSRLRRVSE